MSGLGALAPAAQVLLRHLVLQLQTVVAALYFFHPVAWLACRFSREEADCACDQIAVARGRIPARTYGASLVASVSRSGANVSLEPIPALAPTLRQVMARLEGLLRRHRGVDLGASRSALVYAAARGVVVFAGDGSPGESDPGRVVVVDHGAGLTTVCGHLKHVRVARGASVAAGALLGKVGTTGCSFGPHLHFEVRRGNLPVRPGAVASAREARGSELIKNACRSLPSPERRAA